MHRRCAPPLALVAAVAVAALAGGACHTAPAPEGVGDSAPDVTRAPRDADDERITDPFGPSSPPGRLSEEDLTESDLAGRAGAGDPSWLTDRLEVVYFDFDQSSLTEQARAALERNAALLHQHPDLRIKIEGHCDERGTVEYNLALGDRRASTVKEYLVHLGLDPGRFMTVSFGEERPAAPGHDEASWARNRRAEFHGR